MNNLIKIAIIFFIFLLEVVILMLYKKYNDEALLNFAKLILASSIVFLSIVNFEKFTYFSSKVSNFFNFRKISVNKARKKDFSVTDSWEIFFANSKAPTILVNDNFDVILENESFQNLLDSYEDLDINKLKNLIKQNATHKNNKTSSNNSLVVEIKMTRDEANLFTAFINDIKINQQEKNYYLAMLFDNKEKTTLKEQIFQAQKMQAVGQLAGGIAHDFNNILTAITGFSDLLLSRHNPGDKDFIDLMQIKQNSNRAANLIRQLLAFSRKQTMKLRSVDLVDVFSEINNLIKRLLGENIVLNITYSDEIWSILADTSQLEQVLINLAVNSRDAMLDNSGNLIIDAKNRKISSIRDIHHSFDNIIGSQEIEAGEYVQITFRDDGSGIKKETLEHIFEPFFTTKQIDKGTGLGLATVSGIIEQSGGYIFVSSELHIGTEFIILFRKYEDKDKNSASTKNKEKTSTKQKTKNLIGSGTILLVEDEEPVRIFSTRALQSKGYEVFSAYSGENALEQIESIGADKIDLVVSDVVMPGMSGPEMVEKISEKYPEIKVVFVSGYGEDAFYEKYGTKREFNFLAKPYSLEELAQTVKDLVKK